MVNTTLSKMGTDLDKLVENYPEYTDKYFLRAKQILESEGINPIVRYQVFARQDITALKGVDEAVYFIKQTVGDKAKVYALKNDQPYTAKEPIMKIEGKVQDLIDLETDYLEILSGNLTPAIDLNEIREKARAIRKAAGNKTLLYFGARHFHYTLDEKIAKICQEEGFAGCSTDIGARAWGAKGGGTIPHALVLAYKAYLEQQGIKANYTVEAAKGFDKHIDPSVPRIVLTDTFNKEVTDSIETARALPNLVGVRIDTCGENYTQNSQAQGLPLLDVPKKYLRGKGVKISSAWTLRRALDKEGFNNVGLVVSSGFNAEKTAAFMEADANYPGRNGTPLFTTIGTGSLASPIMTTSDICAYFDEAKELWVPNSKTGRSETPSKRLEEVK